MKWTTAAFNLERSKIGLRNVGCGGSRWGSLWCALLIGYQTAELFTATGWRILPLYKGLCEY